MGGFRSRLSAPLVVAAAVMMVSLSALPAAARYDYLPNDPAFNIQGRYWGNHPYPQGPGMRCTTVMPDGSTGTLWVLITSDSSRRFATAEFSVVKYIYPAYFLGTGEISVTEAYYQPTPYLPYAGTFERHGLRSEATCAWGGWMSPVYGTVELAFKQGQGPDWPTYDELLAWCLDQFGDEPANPSGTPAYEVFCPWQVALPPG